MTVVDKRKNMKKFEDNDIEILLMEDLCPEESGKKKWRIWQKVLLGFGSALLIILVGGMSTFFVLKARGEKGLKTQIEETSTEEARESGHYILHNGKEYRYREDVINILCIGVDKAQSMEEKREYDIYGLADANLLVSIDTEKDQLQIIAIPRDVMTEVQMTTKSGKVVEKTTTQLCQQYGYGRTPEQGGELMMEAVSKLLYQVPIQRYCAINFQALPVLNDAIGGVDVTALQDIPDMKLAAGTPVHLEGENALTYIRWRDQTAEASNLARVERQKQYVLAFLEKAKSVVASDMSVPVTLFQQMQQNMSTNLLLEDITYLAPELVNMSVSGELMRMIPGDPVQGEIYEEYHVNQDALKELVIESFYEEVLETKE